MTADDPDMTDIAATADRLVQRLRDCGPVAVAFSGGVDSAVVARAAFAAWKDRAVAITAVSPSLAESELETARTVATAIGIRHLELSTDEFLRPEYRRNAGDRCFYCKDTLYTLAGDRLQDLQVRCLVNGANTDDRGDHRPGMRAAAEHGVRSPLLEAGLSKSDVRRLARYWKLSVADKPASPCLASRIAYGVDVTPERLRRVEQAEALVRSLTGIDELRVRHEPGDLARIEVPLDRLPDLLAPAVRSAVVSGFQRLGFRSTTLDLAGFRSGNLNAALPVIDLPSGTRE